MPNVNLRDRKVKVVFGLLCIIFLLKMILRPVDISENPSSQISKSCPTCTPQRVHDCPVIACSSLEESSGFRTVLAPIGLLPLTPCCATYEAQKLQDKWVVETRELVGLPSKEFFVDLAANEPIRGSSTVYLERRLDWDGICIEVLQYFNLRRRNTTGQAC